MPDYVYSESSHPTDGDPFVPLPTAEGSFTPMPDPPFPDTPPSHASEVIIHKIWRKGRFCTIAYWETAAKAIVDIGQFDTNTNKLKSSTKCYVDVQDLYAYLYADINDQLDKFFPTFDAEGYVVYGGKGNLARLFKAHWWSQPVSGSNEFSVDKSARVFKCGHFEASVGAGGAIKPNFSKPVSADSIKLSQRELLDIYLSLHSFLSAHPYAKAQGTK